MTDRTKGVLFIVLGVVLGAITVFVCTVWTILVCGMALACDSVVDGFLQSGTVLVPVPLLGVCVLLIKKGRRRLKDRLPEAE